MSTYSVDHHECCSSHLLRTLQWSCYQMFCLHKRFWSSVYTFLHLFVGRIPLSFCSKIVVTRSHSCWRVSITFHTLGCCSPTNEENLLFQPSEMLLVRGWSSNVTWCIFHFWGGNAGGVRRILIGGTFSWSSCCCCGRCRRRPETYVRSL